MIALIRFCSNVIPGSTLPKGEYRDTKIHFWYLTDFSSLWILNPQCWNELHPLTQGWFISNPVGSIQKHLVSGETGGNSSVQTEACYFPTHFSCTCHSCAKPFYLQMAKSLKPNNKQMQLGEIDEISLCKADFTPQAAEIVIVCSRK